MTQYYARLDDIPEAHLDWIREFNDRYSDTVSYEIDMDWSGLYSITLNSESPSTVRQMAIFIATKIQALGHLEKCVNYKEDTRYWVFYFIRNLQMTMRSLLKKVLRSITFKNTSRNS